MTGFSGSQCEKQVISPNSNLVFMQNLMPSLATQVFPLGVAWILAVIFFINPLIENYW